MLWRDLPCKTDLTLGFHSLEVLSMVNAGPPASEEPLSSELAVHLCLLKTDFSETLHLQKWILVHSPAKSVPCQQPLLHWELSRDLSWAHSPLFARCSPHLCRDQLPSTAGLTKHLAVLNCHTYFSRTYNKTWGRKKQPSGQMFLLTFSTQWQGQLHRLSLRKIPTPERSTFNPKEEHMAVWSLLAREYK